MSGQSDKIDVVRASRDGHQFHEAWAARLCLELLPPDTDLSAVAIEGFSHEEAEDVSQTAHEIADLTRYRGGSRILSATKIETLQFKYSVSSAHEPMRAAEMSKTLNKFVGANNDIETIRPAEPELAKFALITNRPIDRDTMTALEALRSGTAAEGRVARHAQQLREAIGLDGEALQEFTRKLSLIGTGEALDATEHGNLKVLASWSGATDNLSHARLANLRRLVRDRAGMRGQDDNVIGRVDVLGALDVAYERDLYPVEAAFPAIETPISRPVLKDLVAALFADTRALLVHAAGGVGKTVLMQALARELDDQHCVLLFDGFGAGRWREPSDGRHLPRKSLPHLANLLAADGLCDIQLPASHLEDNIGALRDRLSASVQALRAFKPDAHVVLILDAIDHCGMQAERTGTQSFAQILLQSLNVAPLDGIRVVASCRSHRRHLAQGDARCREFEIPIFTRDETERLVRARFPTASENDITVLQRRSAGNPRLLDNLLSRGEPFDIERPGGEGETLEGLLREQIDAAQEQAIARGATQAEARGLLAGMAMLPPPVPIEELAAALGLDAGDVQSFVADLFPLIEATLTGLIFRDEPTETLVVEMIGADTVARSDLVARLLARQDRSIYAARALPGILVEVGEIDTLVTLAFDSLSSPDLGRVAHRAIRLARLEAAASACARGGRTDDLTRITVEASRIASASERSDAYLRAHPDLVALSEDPEAIRRFRDDRSGWPGVRHSALAVLDAFSGDMHSASLESDRALTWFNWSLRERREGRSKGHKDLALLEAEAIFVQLLLGKAVRVDRWLSGLNDIYAFKIAADMLAFVDRLAKAKDASAPADKMIAAMAKCRTQSPVVIAAILERIEVTPDTRCRLLTRLAKLEPEPFEPGSYFDYRREDRLSDALLTAGGQAIGMGLVREAQAIVLHAPAPDLRTYEIDDPWPLSGGSVSRHLKRAAIAAAARRRSTAITDIVPEEMCALVPLSIRRRGPAAFERHLRAVLTKAQNDRAKRKRKLPGSDEARRWERLLSHRLAPLTSLVDDVAAILTTDRPGPAIAAALARAENAITSASNYPYRDQDRFLRHLCLDVLRWAAQCRAPLDQASGEALAAFLEQSGSQLVSDWLRYTALLARGKETQAAALRLAGQAERVIAADTDVSKQIQSYGMLARALLPISPDEARPYFRIGLELADAVGSDDQERIGDFITFAAQYSGEPLPAAAVHQFVRLCELNFPDEAEALDWRNFAKAMSAIGSTGGLAAIARLSDRDKVGLGWTLTPMLKALVERDRLRPTLAAGLFGLAAFESTWNWFPPEVARPIMVRLPGHLREVFADMIVVDLDREDAARPHRETVNGLKRLFQDELSEQAAARKRIVSLHADRTRGTKAETAPTARPKPIAPDALRKASAITADELRAAIEQGAAAFEGYRPTDGFILSGFVADVTEPGPRTALLSTVVEDLQLSFADKLSFLEEAQEQWAGQSRALDGQLEEAALGIALRDLGAVVRSGDSWRRPLSRIARLAGGARERLVAAVLKATPGQNLEVSSDFWMACAIELARTASASAIGDALGRYAEHSTQSLPDTIGDGPWTRTFSTTDEEDTIVADLLWMRLGAPDAASRWRAAHSIRRLVALGETHFLDALVAGIDRTGAGAFQDQTLPFFHLHARLWLLIAIARLASDAPATVLPYRNALEAIATSESFPHALCRHFAILALRALALSGSIPEPGTYLAWLETLNVPAMPRVSRSGHRPGFYDMRPADRPEHPSPFRFDYDFDKYQIDPLGRLFGLPKWDVQDAATNWIRRYDAEVKTMYDCPRPRWSSEDDRSYGSTSFPDIDRYGGYLAWHALMLTAGQFAADKPIIGDSWQETPWESWLAEKTLSRSDGLWLADGTDLFPLEDARSVVPYMPGASETGSVPSHPLDLLPLAGFDDSLNLPSSFLVSGSWESIDGLDVTIGSQLVERDMARTVAHAVYSADPFFAYLPVDEDDGFDRRDNREKQLLTRWLSSDDHAYTKLDERDPFGFKTALQRVRPSAQTVEKMSLWKADAFERLWVDSADQWTFRADAWGTRRGHGRHATERGGTRLAVKWDALKPLLEAEQQALLLLIKVRRYIEKDPKDDHFRHQMLALIVRPDQPLEVLYAVPKPVRAAIANLGHYERGEFGDRLTAIEAAGCPRRQAWPRSRARRKTSSDERAPSDAADQ